MTREDLKRRYRRNMALAGFGERGQRRLLASSALVIGAGGLGSAALPYLVAAGVGRVGIVDADTVAEHNLQRQVLHHRVGDNKAESAAERLRPLNPGVEIVTYPEFAGRRRIVELADGYDVVLDCTDSFESKLSVSDACAEVGRPLVWAAALGMCGQCSVFGVPDSRGDVLWLRDLYPEAPVPSLGAEETGVLGALVGQVGTVQATEAVKLLAGFGAGLVGRVWVVDAAAGRWDVVPLRLPD